MIIEGEDGTAIGDLGWFGVPYGPNRRSVAWKIGCTIDVPHRGRGHGSRAQRLLAEHLFATTASNRVEADTDVENVAEQRALERAGFTRDGVVRGAQFRAGGWHDLVLYSILRAEA
jgi:RimJ/RimL family protein N-acetyltransferase